MKLAFTAAAAFVCLSTAAFAGVLPITGEYCDRDRSDGDFSLILNADGMSGQEDVIFAKVVKSGPNWWLVAYKAEGTDPGSFKITRSRDKRTVIVGESNPVTLYRCRLNDGEVHFLDSAP